MVILRQKEFVSRSLRFKVGVETGKRNLRFLGKLGKLAGSRIVETGNILAVGGGHAAKKVAKDVVAENKRTLNFMKKSAQQLASKDTPLSKRLHIVGEIATDMVPKAAFTKHAINEVHHIGGKTGKDIVQSLAEGATNPMKKLGQKMLDFRQGGHGGVGIAGKWVGPGTNKWCLGLAPDTIVTSAGNQFEQYKGKDRLQREVSALVNSKEGRRFARSYDKLLGKRLNAAHEGVNKTLNPIPKVINRLGTAIGAVFRRKPQPVPVPAAI